MVYPVPQVGLLEERPAVSGGRERTQREELQCHVESDTAEGAVVKTRRVLLAPSFGKENDCSVEGLCTFRVIDRGNSEVRLPSSRDHGHLEVRVGLCLHGKSSRRSRVIDVQILEGSMAGRTGQGVRGCSISMDHCKLVNDVITSDAIRR